MCARVCGQVDRDGSGEIDYHEFASSIKPDEDDEADTIGELGDMVRSLQSIVSANSSMHHARFSGYAEITLLF